MAAFEISVNGQRRFVGEEVSAITLSADPAGGPGPERVYVHVGIGEAGDYEVQYLGGDLRPGDKISIRVLSHDEEVIEPSGAPGSCSFCGTDKYNIAGLVAGPGVAICNDCIRAFQAVIAQGSALPLGASVQDRSDSACNFCLKSPPEIPGLLVRNTAAICPECLHVCVDLISGS